MSRRGAWEALIVASHFALLVGCGNSDSADSQSSDSGDGGADSENGGGDQGGTTGRGGGSGTAGDGGDEATAGSGNEGGETGTSGSGTGGRGGAGDGGEENGGTQTTGGTTGGGGSGGTAQSGVVAVGNQYSCSELASRAVKCWGFNGQGRLGQGDTANRGEAANQMGAALAPIAFGSRTVQTISAGNAHACALFQGGSLACWGSNGFGQLGVGDINHRGDGAGEMGAALAAVGLGTGRTATAVSCGASVTCALLDNGSVKCWGWNMVGQLGLEDTDNRGDGAGEMGNGLPPVNLGAGRTALALSAGSQHVCALLDNGSVKCWGSNISGQLGQGDNDNRGDDATEMVTLAAIDLGAGRSAKAISAGTNHTCAILDNDALKCWGSNTDGRLGLGDTEARGDQPGEMGNALPAVALGTGRHAVTVSAGGAHTCAILDTGDVKCWGNSATGALGLGNTNARGDQAGEMGDALPVVSLGAGRHAAGISAGTAHTCALLDNGNVKCWGNNGAGALGLGDTDHRGDAAAEMGDALPPVDL